MAAAYEEAVATARKYYDSDDADNFYHEIWGGEDIHIGLYESDDEDVRAASRRTVEALARRLRLGPASRVLDLGAGYGGAARRLAASTGCRVMCLNLSETQNRRNRALTRAAGLDDRIDVTDGNFEELPFGDASFDVAWSQDSFLHSGRRAAVLGEIDRVLRPGAEVIFTDPMQADGCPPGVLGPVLERIHLEDLGSFGFYRSAAAALGWETLEIADLTEHLVTHYSRIAAELGRRRADLDGKVSAAYIDRMLRGLDAWIEAARSGYLAWGVLHFRKPAKLPDAA